MCQQASFLYFCMEAQLSLVNGSPLPRCRGSDPALAGSLGCGEGDKHLTGSSCLRWARGDMFMATQGKLSKRGDAQGSHPWEGKGSIHRSWGKWGV